MLAALRDARFSQGLACARCGSRRVQRWGTARGRQRYRCLACRRTFSDLTGTPAAYLKKPELLGAYATCMRESLSVRESARRTGVHASTAFRWRHRLLDALGRASEPVLRGSIEIDCFWLAHSRKGERRVRDRPARRRAPRCLITFSGRRVCVLLACDRLGQVASGLTPRPDPDPDAVERVLAGRVSEEGAATSRTALVSTKGRFGPAARLARTKGWGFLHARSGGLLGPGRWPAHVRTVVAYRLRLRRWLPRFRGVATKYLPNYLAWHRSLDATLRAGIEANLMRWPLAAGFG